MRNDTTRNTKIRQVADDRPRRRVLGLAVLVLTLGTGYLAAQYSPDDAVAALAEEIELEESAPHRPTIAEIMAQIDEVATRHRVPPRLVAAVIAVESEFNPRAVSRRGAQGLMQLMPATAAHLDVQDSFDTRENIDGGVRHLRVLMDRYHNDLPLVLAAYNAGDRAVISYRGVPPYPETRRYVIRVLRRFDRDAARVAAQRIYGPGPTATPTVSRVAYPRTQLAVMQVHAPPAPEVEAEVPVVVAPPPPPPPRPGPLAAQGP
jgi:soluble lytic murein transglycosylase-like protein